MLSHFKNNKRETVKTNISINPLRRIFFSSQLFWMGFFSIITHYDALFSRLVFFLILMQFSVYFYSNCTIRLIFYLFIVKWRKSSYRPAFKSLKRLSLLFGNNYCSDGSFLRDKHSGRTFFERPQINIKKTSVKQNSPPNIVVLVDWHRFQSLNNRITKPVTALYA